MFSYVWPIALIVFSDTFYHICAKNTPADMDPLAALTVTYLCGTIGCLVLFFMLNKGASLMVEYRKLNWAPVALGIVIIGLEAGSLYAYRAGWPVNTMSVVKASLLAVILVFVGKAFYNEPLTWNKIVGLTLYVAAVFFMNMTP